MQWKILLDSNFPFPTHLVTFVLRKQEKCAINSGGNAQVVNNLNTDIEKYPYSEKELGNNSTLETPLQIELLWVPYQDGKPEKTCFQLFRKVIVAFESADKLLSAVEFDLQSLNCRWSTGIKNELESFSNYFC